MITERAFRGRTVEQSSAVTITIGYGYLVWLVTMTAGSRKVLLPDARLMRAGDEPIIVVNAGPTNNFAVANNGNTVDITAALTPGQWCRLSLLDNSTANGSWRARVSSPLT